MLDARRSFNARSKRSAYVRHTLQLIAVEIMVERLASVLLASKERLSAWITLHASLQIFFMHA